MLKNNEILENKKDDWLAEEKAREKRRSPWNLDEAKELKESHAIRHAHVNRIREENKPPKVMPNLFDKQDSFKKPSLIDTKYLVLKVVITTIVFIVIFLIVSAMFASLKQL